MTRPAAIALLGLVACNQPPEPRPGTQIGVEESGSAGCADDTVTPVTDLGEVPEGATSSLGEVLEGSAGRFVGSTRDGEPLTLEVEPDLDSAEWVIQVPLDPSGEILCPPVWRLDVEAVVRTDDVDWTGFGALSLQDDGDAFLQAEGPAELGMDTPPEVDADSAHMLAFGVDGSYALTLMWRGRAGVDFDGTEVVALQGDVDAE